MLTLQPESVNEETAQASRKAYRAYARSIENEQPEYADKLRLYVENLDKKEIDNKKRGRTLDTEKNVNFCKQLCLALLHTAPCSQAEMYYVFEKCGHAKYQRYLWHALRNLVGEHKVRLIKQNYELIQNEED